MSLLGRVIGYLLILAALVVVAAEAIDFATLGEWNIMSAGELWYRIDRASLNGAQAVIQRIIAPWLWDPVIATILSGPAAAVLGLPGLALVVFCRRRRERRGRFRS